MLTRCTAPPYETSTGMPIHGNTIRDRTSCKLTIHLHLAPIPTKTAAQVNNSPISPCAACACRMPNRTRDKRSCKCAPHLYLAPTLNQTAVQTNNSPLSPAAACACRVPSLPGMLPNGEDYESFTWLQEIATPMHVPVGIYVGEPLVRGISNDCVVEATPDYARGGLVYIIRNWNLRGEKRVDGHGLCSFRWLRLFAGLTESELEAKVKHILRKQMASI